MKVFLSYSTNDSKVADKVVKMLQKLDIEFFRDQKNISWGDDIRDKVGGGLKDCTHLMVLLSAWSRKSEWVPYETGYATALNKTILPYLVDTGMEVPGFLKHMLYYVDDMRKVKAFFEKAKEAYDNTYTSLEEILTHNKWRLIFNPPNKNKPISFEPKGIIGVGQNRNESTWRIDDGKLELVQGDGKVHSRFVYDATARSFLHTNDSDLSSIRGQIIELDT